MKNSTKNKSEKEEIMGLLLGNIQERVATIYDVCIINRSYKKSDRVEVSPQDLVEATMTAEKLSETGFKTRVVGWYHSHPHITPWPSHVDLTSQNSYQMLDKCFVGLIFSVYSTAKTGEETIQLYAFQSVTKEFTDPTEVRVTQFERKSVQLFVIHSPEMYHFPCNSVRRVSDLISTLFEEEKKEFYHRIKNNKTENIEEEEEEIGESEDDYEKKNIIGNNKNNNNNPMNLLINSSIYQYNLLKLMQKFVPFKNCITEDFEKLKIKLERLKKIEVELHRKIEEDSKPPQKTEQLLML